MRARTSAVRGTAVVAPPRDGSRRVGDRFSTLELAVPTQSGHHRRRIRGNKRDARRRAGQRDTIPSARGRWPTCTSMEPVTLSLRCRHVQRQHRPDTRHAVPLHGLPGAIGSCLSHHCPGPHRGVRHPGPDKSYVKVAQSGNRRGHVFCPECATPLYATAPENATFVSIRLGCVRQIGSDRLPRSGNALRCHGFTSCLPWPARPSSRPCCLRRAGDEPGS